MLRKQSTCDVLHAQVVNKVTHTHTHELENYNIDLTLQGNDNYVMFKH